MALLCRLLMVLEEIKQIFYHYMKANTIKTLRNLLLCLLVATAMVGCKDKDKEEECVPPALSQQIIGNWMLSTSLGNFNLSFTQNGVVEGNLSTILNLAQIQGVDKVTYTVNGDNGITLRGLNSSGDEVGVLPFTVKERECKKIVLNTVLGEVTLSQ